jgi:hypothetical protein
LDYEFKIGDNECILFYQSCLKFKEDNIPTNDNWDNLSKANLNQAISLMEELDRCVKEDSQLEEQYKSCMEFLQIFIHHASK